MTTITFFENKYAKSPSHVEKNMCGKKFIDLFQDISHEIFSKKEEATVFSMATYKSEGNRKRENIKLITGLRYPDFLGHSCLLK